MELNEKGEVVFHYTNEIIFNSFLEVIKELENVEIGNSEKQTGEILVNVRSGFANINQIPFILNDINKNKTLVKINWSAERVIIHRGPYQGLETNRAIIEKIIFKVMEKVSS